MLKTILYVEEYENCFINALLKRDDINLVIIRFRHCYFFSSEHINATQDIPQFIIDKKAPIMEEACRLSAFLQRENITVDYFYNDSEFNQIYIQQIARILSLPGALSEKQATIVRDKVRMKEFIRSIGYKCPDFRQLNQFDDALQCANEWGYPFIIKWRTGVSSIKVFRVEDFLNLSELELDYESGEYMAERFCPYTIWCIDAIVSDGKVCNNLYTWLPYTNLSFAENKSKFAQIAVGEKPSHWTFDSRKLTQDIVDKLELTNGYLHLEAFITDELEPIICEFAWRTPGDHMLSNFSYLYGKDIAFQLIDAILGIGIDPLVPSTRCVADVFLPMVEGRIVEISSLDNLKEYCSILDGSIYYKTGDVLISKQKYTDCTGWVQINANSLGDMMAKIDNVYSRFRLIVEKSQT